MASQFPHSPIGRDEQLRHLRFLDSLTAAPAGRGSGLALYATAVQRVCTPFGGASPLLALDPVRPCLARGGAGPLPTVNLRSEQHGRGDLSRARTHREIRRVIPYDHSASNITVQPGATQMSVRAEKVVRQGGN